jgi:hypothetical protein
MFDCGDVAAMNGFEVVGWWQQYGGDTGGGQDVETCSDCGDVVT